MASFTAPWKSATPGPTMADARTESLPHSPKWRLLAAEELARPGQMRLQPVRRGAWVVDLRWVDIDVRAARALQHLPEGLVGKRLLDVLAGRRGHRSIFDHYRRVLETGVPEVALQLHVDLGSEDIWRHAARRQDDEVVVTLLNLGAARRALALHAELATRGATPAGGARPDQAATR